MIAVRMGYSRLVFLVGGVAIKVPNILHGERAFVIGQDGNIHEWEVYQTALIENCGSVPHHLAQLYFRLPFGLALVCKRYFHELLYVPNFDVLQTLPLSGLDTKIGNYTLDDSGELVVLDYGNSDVWYVKHNDR